MPAKKTAKSGKAGKITKKSKTKKQTGTCTVCSVGVKPMMSKMQEEPIPGPTMPGPEMDNNQSCPRCDHIPGRVSAVIGLLAVVIVVLSMTVLASVMVISSQAFQIEAYNSSGGYIDNIVRK